MRIGFDGRWYNKSGVGNYVSELLQALGRLNEDFEIVLYEDPQNPLDHIKGEHFHKVAVHAKKYSFQEQLELASRCRTDRLSLFHSPFYVTPWFATCPVVATLHDLIPFLFKSYSLPKTQVIRCGYRMAANKAVRLITDSENSSRDLQRILQVPSSKIRVVHLATSPEYFYPEQHEGELEYLSSRYGVRRPYALTFSAKNWKTKNLPTVLEAMSICRQQLLSNFQIVVTGPSEGFWEAERKFATKLANVVLTDFVSAADLGKLYRGATVFLIGSKYEGFGLPLLEAMSCGCAVVSSNGGSLPEVGGAGAIVVEAGDALSMARSAARLLSHSDELHQQQARSKRRAADFSWENTARQTLAVYREVAAKCSLHP